jgi:hypothetical protein
MPKFVGGQLSPRAQAHAPISVHVAVILARLRYTNSGEAGSIR